MHNDFDPFFGPKSESFWVLKIGVIQVQKHVPILGHFLGHFWQISQITYFPIFTDSIFVTFFHFFPLFICVGYFWSFVLIPAYNVTDVGPILGHKWPKNGSQNRGHFQCLRNEFDAESTCFTCQKLGSVFEPVFYGSGFFRIFPDYSLFIYVNYFC